MEFQITLIFIALMAILQFPMTVAVGLYRVKTDIHFMDGGNMNLMRRMRAHGNFTETVPITLLAMAGAEYVGTPQSLLWIGGSALVAGRLIHYATVARFGWGNGRAAGMLLTFTAMIGFSVCILYKAVS